MFSIALLPKTYVFEKSNAITTILASADGSFGVTTKLNYRIVKVVHFGMLSSDKSQSSSIMIVKKFN